MEYRLTFAVEGAELEGDQVVRERVSGLIPTDMPALQSELATAGLAEARAYVEPGSVGKGASGPGVTLVLVVAERVMNDAASVLALGGALWALVRQVRGRRERQLVVQQPETIGALALAAAQPRASLAGAYVMETVCLTGGGPGLGTDARDVWATPTVLQSGDVWIVFSSASGLVLGDVVVPAEWTPGRGELDAADVPTVFARLNVRQDQ